MKHRIHALPSRHPYRSPKAFTLLEILVVVVLLTVITVMATPSVLGLVKSSRLSTAGDNVLNHLAEAQLTALSEFTDVEVRFYELRDFIETDAAPQLRGLQSYALRFDPSTESEGAFKAATPVVHLDYGVSISSDEHLSSLTKLKWNEDAGVNGGPKRRYVAFRFHSDGSTDLTPGEQWFLTLAEQKASKNYYTIQIDPETGRVRTFRP